MEQLKKAVDAAAEKVKKAAEARDKARAEVDKKADAVANKPDDKKAADDLNKASEALKTGEVEYDKARAELEKAENALSTAEAKAKSDAKKPDYVVAKGRSVTSRKGIKGEGEEVTADHFPGGKDTLDSLIKRGIVVKP